MSKKAESRLQRRIRDMLEKCFPGSFWFKVHGGPFQVAGIPDLLGCVNGLYFGLEIKVPGKGKLSAIQIDTLQRINDAGGYAAEITSAQEAVDFVYSHLATTGRLSAECSRVLPRRANRGVVLRAGDRKNLDRGRSDRSPVKPNIRRTPRRPTSKPREQLG